MSGKRPPRSDVEQIDLAIEHKASGRGWRFRDAQRCARLAIARTARTARRKADRDLWGIADGDEKLRKGVCALDDWPAAIEHEFWRHECVEHFWPFFLHAWGTLHGPH